MHSVGIATSCSHVIGPELWAQLQWDSDIWLIASGERMAQPGFPYREAAPALYGDDEAVFGIAYRVSTVDVPAALHEILNGGRRSRHLELQEIEAETPAGPVTGYVFAPRRQELRKAA
jgi:hypothetical protein